MYSDGAQREAGDAGNGVDDDHPAGAIEIGDRRAQLADPQHVEEDVQDAAVQPARGEQRPPAADSNTGTAPLAPSRIQHRGRLGDSTDLNAVARQEQRQHDTGSIGAAGDDRHEAEVVAEARSAGPKPHSPGLRRPQL